MKIDIPLGRAVVVPCRGSVKEDHATKDPILGPVADHVGNSVGILVFGIVRQVLKQSQRRRAMLQTYRL